MNGTDRSKRGAQALTLGIALMVLGLCVWDWRPAVAGVGLAVLGFGVSFAPLLPLVLLGLRAEWYLRRGQNTRADLCRRELGRRLAQRQQQEQRRCHHA